MKLMDVFVNSILRPKELVNVTIQTKDRFKRYLFFLSLLVTVMVFVIPVACRIISFGGFNKLFTETMPEISMNDGKLEADKRFEMNLGYADILIDTNLSEYKFEDFTTEGYFIAIGSDTTKFVRVGDKKDADSYSVIYAYSNAELFPNGFNNQFLVKCIPLIYIAFVFAFFLLAAMLASALAALRRVSEQGWHKFKRILIFHIITNKINKKLTWLLLPTIKLKRFEIEYLTLIILMGIQNHPATKNDSL